MKKTIGILVCFLLVVISIPVTKSTLENNLTNNNSEPILEVSINPGFYVYSLGFNIYNVGNAIAHNVTFSSIYFTGKILYNSRPFFIIEELQPGQTAFSRTYSFIGLGLFTVNITVTCDEGCIATDSKNGIALGVFYYIP